jgi:Domain of unknown function (DUF4202)
VTPSGGRGRFESAAAAIDARNAGDPNRIVVDGVERPKEQAHAEMVTAWVRRLDPDADEAQLLAARAHHLRRWALPRTDFPEGRAGYLRWRTEAKKRHAEEVAGVLAGAGYDPATIERVQAIITKRGLGSDPGVQVHEDALCLVFLQTQLDDLLEQLGEERTVTVLAKTAKKMSPAGLAAAVSDVALSDAGRRAFEAALATTT